MRRLPYGVIVTLTALLGCNGKPKSDVADLPGEKEATVEYSVLPAGPRSAPPGATKPAAPDTVRTRRGWDVAYTYDVLGRPAKVLTPAGAITYDYRTVQGEVTRTLPNKVRTVWRSRPDGKLESITHAGAANKVLLKLSYSYRYDGLIDTIKE